MTSGDQHPGSGRLRGAVVVARCQRTTSATFGIRLYHDGSSTWSATWAFAIDPARADREGYTSTALSGRFAVDPAYPGCPSCGGTSFVLCSSCRRVGCWPGSGHWTCPFCGVGGMPAGAMTSLTVTND
ncbi:hypothetical protein [Catenulispora rubra]|uniref:hypothetical protein n=1 Tax=Catenulispora rubra TaxID=280293 RepID=UPI0018928341|nr:hypothetical protein [Catenulispora rubra]